MRTHQHARPAAPDGAVRVSRSAMPPWIGTLFGVIASLILVKIEAPVGGLRVRLFDVVLAMFVAWMLLVQFQGSRFPSTRGRSTFLLFGAFGGYVVLNATMLSGVTVAVTFGIQVIEFLLFAYLLSIVLSDDAARWRFLVAFTVSLWLTALVNLGLHLSLGSFISFKEYGDMKLTYGLAAMLTLFLLLTRVTPAAFFRLFIAVIVMLLLLLLSAERKSWVAFGVAVLVTVPLVFTPRAAGTRQLTTAIGRLAFTAPILLVMVSMVVFSVPEINRRVMSTVGAFVIFVEGENTIVVDAAYESISNNARIFIAELAMDIYVANPVFGVGLEGFKNTVRNVMWDIPEKFRVAAHNEYLSVAAETGTVGLVLYLGIWFSVLFKSIRLGAARYTAGIPPIDRLVVIGLTVYSMTICFFLSTSATTLFFLTFPIGYAAALKRRYANVRRQARVRDPAFAHAVRS